MMVDPHSDNTLAAQYFPSWRLGYRSNPFRTLTREEWMDVALLPEPLHDVIEQDCQIIQILGKKGSGKTSALLALKKAWQKEGVGVAYAYVAAEDTHINLDLGGLQLLLLDEAQRLEPSAFEYLLSNVSSRYFTPNKLIFTSHSDLIRTGRGEVGALSLTLEQPSSDFIVSLIEQRLTYFELVPSKGVRLSQPALTYAIESSDFNLRKLERLLYEAYQTWDRKAHISRSHVVEQIKGRS